MCSNSTLPSLQPTTTTNGMLTFRPVGLMPGKMAGMSQSWVKLIMTSSTSWLSPTVRETGVTTVSSGQWPMNQVW
jgi:hypothetical protein